MSLVDTNEVNTCGTRATALKPRKRISSGVTESNGCPHDAFRNNYNDEVAALRGKLTEVSSQLVSLQSLQAEVSRQTSRSVRELNIIEQRLAARPPAKPPGSTLPLDMYDQLQRGRWWTSITTSSLDDGVEVLLAHHIPQSISCKESINQIIPTAYLKNLRPPIQGKNGSQLYLLEGNRLNSRATMHVSKGTRNIHGHALWVPYPLQTESWFPLIIKEPSHDAEQSAAFLQQSIERFTIDTLYDGSLLLSFADKNDQLLAKIALSS